MSVVINSNAAATVASNNLAASNTLLQKSLNRLSSGSKIVSPADDAGGLAVSMKLSATAKRQNATKSNLGNTVSFLQTQDGALKVTGKILDRISELKVMYGDVTKSATDRGNYDTEYQALKAQLTAIGSEKFNGINLFGSSTMTVGLNEQGLSGPQMSIGGVDLLGSGTAGSGSSISDNFSGGSIDSLLWSTLSPSVNSAVSQSGGILTSTDRGYLTSNGVFGGPMEINARVRINEANGLATIAWKNDGVANNAGGWFWPANGSLTFTLSGMSNNINLGATGSGGSLNPMPVVVGQWYDVRISDNGSSISVYMDNSATANLTMAYDPNLAPTTGKVSFLSREKVGSDFSASLDSIAITPGSSTDAGTVASTDSLANISLSTITDAIDDIATYRAQNGAQQSRLGYATEMLTVNEANLEAANSRIVDVDVAEESTALARSNILVQAGTSMLSQANQSAQMVLKLLNG